MLTQLDLRHFKCFELLHLPLRSLTLLAGTNAKGERTAEGHEIYQRHFAGQRAWFSDSSDTEKRDFQNDLTFLLNDGTSLLCSWHGKVNYHIPLRIHFSWPVTAVDPLYIVYVGPKLTLR